MGITKIKSAFRIAKVITLLPQPNEGQKSFIEKIEIDGAYVSVKMLARTEPYNYIITPTVKQSLIETAEAGDSLGKFYNANLRGHEVK